MKKHSSTEDLLARLGSSLKSSPLDAQVRSSTPAPRTEVEGRGGVAVAAKEISAQAVVTSAENVVRMPSVQKTVPQPAAQRPEEEAIPQTAALPRNAETEALMERIIAMGKIISPDRARKLEADWQARKEMPSSAVQAPGGVWSATRSVAETRASWKSASVGLYAADYEKIRAVMDYIQTQTGERVNLSRVVKLALRALPMGPTILAVNEEVKKNDRRARI
jgi:hypothetical protein